MFECFYKGKVKDINAYQEKLKNENLQFSRKTNIEKTQAWGWVQIRMSNSQIRFTETFNVFRRLKCFKTLWESSNILKLYIIKKFALLTLSLLGYLKTRINWGGGIWPPSKSHVWCPNMTNDTSLENSCALLLESAKKLQICKSLFFFLQNPVM